MEPVQQGIHARAGFVLTGGASIRMGRDKAGLPFAGRTLVEYVAACVREAAGNVTLVGAPERYSDLGFDAMADHYPGCGPLGGICTALEQSTADWNLIVACDMPGVSAAFLKELLRAAEASGADGLVPETATAAGSAGRQLHPLCAVYHRRVLSRALRQIGIKSFKMHEFLAILPIVRFPVAAPFVQNVNTPLDWAAR